MAVTLRKKQSNDLWARALLCAHPVAVTGRTTVATEAEQPRGGVAARCGDHTHDQRPNAIQSAQLRWKTYGVVAMLLLLCCLPLHATDMHPEALELRSDTLNLQNRYAGFPLTLSFRIKNNNVLTAEQFTIGMSVKSVDGTITYTSKTQPDTNDLSPFTGRTYTVRDFYTPERAGLYNLLVFVYYYNDIDRSNDTLISGFEVKPGRDSLLSIMRGVLSNGFDSTTMWGMMHPVPLTTATTMTAFDVSAGYTYTPTKETWLGYVDRDRHTRMNHATTLYLFDGANPTTPVTTSLSTWLLLNGKTAFPDPLDTLSVIAPPALKPYSGSTISIHLPAQPLLSGGRTGALLVSGPGWNTFDQHGLDGNTERMKEEFLTDTLSIRMPSVNIQTLNAPTPDLLESSLDGLQGKHDTLIFYYSGHSDALGKPLLGGGVTTDYNFLSNKLFTSGAKNINLIFDNNYSGTAIDSVKGLVNTTPQYRSLDITLLASSAANKTTKDIILPIGNRYTTISEFTLGLAQSMGNPDADSMNTRGVSLVEAFTRLREINPVLQSGDRMDTTMIPQLWLQRSRLAGSSPTLVFDDADIEIVQQPGIPTNTLFTVQLSTTPFAVVPTDTSVISISTGRYWKLRIEPAVPFTVDLNFRVRGEYDTLLTGLGIPGVVRRSEPGQPWSAHYPIVWNAGSQTLTAKNVDRFSEWAIAMVKEEPVSTGVADDRLHGLYSIGDISPNPFSSATTIQFECAGAGIIDLAIVDMLGNSIQTLASGLYQAGTYSVVFDGTTFGSGIYFCRLMVDGKIQTRTLLRIQ